MRGRQKVSQLRRIRLLPEQGGGTLHFQIMDHGRPEFLSVDEVPEFEGEEAWFLLERVRGQVWMTWKVLRQVADPQAAHREILGW
jgi:hypothetical protein